MRRDDPELVREVAKALTRVMFNGGEPDQPAVRWNGIEMEPQDFPLWQDYRDEAVAAIAAYENYRKQSQRIAEAGWLIEYGNDGEGITTYLSLDKTVTGYWTRDNLLATRFGRKSDAEDWLASQDTIDPETVSVVEHMWTANVHEFEGDRGPRNPDVADDLDPANINAVYARGEEVER